MSVGGGRGGRQSQAFGAQQRADAAGGRPDGEGFGSRRPGGLSGGSGQCGVSHSKLPCLHRLCIGPWTVIENCIFLSACYSISYDSPRAALGRTAHLSEVMRDGSLSARDGGSDCATHGRPAYRRSGGRARAAAVRTFAARPRADRAAANLSPHVEAMAAASAALARAAAGEASATQGCARDRERIIGCEVLPAIFATFRAKNPGVAIELALTNRKEDLSRRDADIAVRMVRPTQAHWSRAASGIAHRALCPSGLSRAVRHADLLAELAEHRLIGFDRDDRAFRSVGELAGLLSRESSASAATAISRSSRRCAPASGSAAARKTSPGARPS